MGIRERESWKAIPGYEGLYEVSNMGRVRNKKGKILKPFKSYRAKNNQDGYLRVDLYKNGKRYQPKNIGRLVLLAFKGPPPEPDYQADHKDGDKTHNRLDNLRWLSNADNSYGRSMNMRRNMPVGVHMNDSGKFVATVSVNNKRIYCGSYFTPEAAKRAYLKEREKHHGPVTEI